VRPLRAHSLVALLAWVTAPGAALAQGVSAAVSAGTVTVRYEDAPVFSALTLSNEFAFVSPRVNLAASGTLVRPASAGLTQQGGVGVSFFSRATARGFLGEAGGAVGGSVPPSGAGTGQGVARARVHWLGVGRDVWAGAGFGTMWDASRRLEFRRVDLGAALRGVRHSLTMGFTPTEAGGVYRYQDLTGQVGTSVGPFDLRASAGARFGAELPITAGDQRTWAALGVHAWLAPRVAIVGGFGTYPVDLTEGYPAGRYASIAIRIGAWRALEDETTARERRIRRDAARAGVRDFAVRPDGEGTVEVRVRAPGAARVEITGDLTGWAPVQLAPDESGWWLTRVRTRSLTVEMMVRIDGGTWVVPPGAEVVTDEFGGRTGRLVIRGR
jgi:hypothetical protein